MKSHLLKNRKQPQLHHTKLNNSKRSESVHVTHKNKTQAQVIAKPSMRAFQHASLFSRSYLHTSPFQFAFFMTSFA